MFQSILGKNRGSCLRLRLVRSLRTGGIYLISGSLFISLKTIFSSQLFLLLPISQSVDPCSMSCPIVYQLYLWSQSGTNSGHEEGQDEREWGRINANALSWLENYTGKPSWARLLLYMTRKNNPRKTGLIRDCIPVVAKICVLRRVITGSHNWKIK